MTLQELETWTKILTSSVNIIFFIIIGVVTILSYINAKRTLFTPIKTEVFKMQIKDFEEVLKFFKNKTEHDFMQLFDYDNIFRINAIQLVDHYVRTFFPNHIKLPADRKTELRKDVVGTVITQEFASKHIIRPEDIRKPNDEKKNDVITNPAIILNNWMTQIHGALDYTKKYDENISSLETFTSSPLLPEELKKLITNFRKKATDNLFLMNSILDSISKELPTKFPTADSLKELELSAFWNKYNKEMDEFMTDATEILNFIKKYLKIEDLIK